MSAALAFERRPGVPQLAWVARARPGAPVLVRHGIAVETRSDGFVEGAWDDEFGAWDFDRASALAGSGARVRDGMVIFAAPFHPLERLFALHADGETFVSNSLVYLLVEAGDGLDPAHPGYFFDFVTMVRRGIAAPPARLPTARGRRIEVYAACNVVLSPSGALTRLPRPTGPPPACYADYVGRLVDTTVRLAANAVSPLRSAAYRLVAACSRGYDSTAGAAIAARAGCREGVTFRRSNRAQGHPIVGVAEETGDDSGADTLERLGMRVAEFDRADFRRLPGHPRAEFFLSSPAAVTDAAMQVMQTALAGSVFVSGRHGERYWGPTRRCRRRHFREVDDCHLSGQALGEFRLRTGFVHYPVPYVGALHGPAIHRITHSAEMRPWRLGTGYYDRPIARRIAEEAGVPRESFGQRKLGAGLVDRALPPASERDFQVFLQTTVPDRVRRRLDGRPWDERLPRHRLLAHLRTHYAHWPLADRALVLCGTERLHALWNSVHLYQFHWGFEKVRRRYAG